MVSLFLNPENIMDSFIASQTCYLVSGTSVKNFSGRLKENKSIKSENATKLSRTGENTGPLPKISRRTCALLDPSILSGKSFTYVKTKVQQTT